MFDPFAHMHATVVRYPWTVISVWLFVLVVAGGLLVPRTAKALRAGGFFVPDAESSQAAATMDREFDAANRNTVVVVFRSPTLTVDDGEFVAQVAGAERRLSLVGGVRRLTSYYQTGTPVLVGRDRHSAITQVTVDGTESEVQQRVAEIRGALDGVTLEHYVTGQPASNVDVRTVSEQDLQRAELVTLPIVAVLLLLVFRTVVAAALPLVLGVSSVVLALAAMYLVTLKTDVSIFALNTATMIGLGLGVDFSAFIVNRFEEELDAGLAPAEAAERTMATAGRSIAYSASIVVLGMLILTVLVDLLVVRSTSLAVTLVTATGLLAALTLLPALLVIIGHRIRWLRVVPGGRREARSAGQWYRMSRAIMVRPGMWFATGLIILAVLSLPAINIRLMGVALGSLPPEAESTRGYEAVSQALGPNRLEPIQIVIRTEQTNGAFTPQFLTGLERLTSAIAADPRIDQVFSLASAAQAIGFPSSQFATLNPAIIRATPARAAQAQRLVNLTRGSNAATINAFVKYPAFDERHLALVRDLRDRIIPGISELRPYSVQVGGLAAGVSDYADALYNRMPILVAAVMVTSFIMMLLFFRSIVLPLKAIALNVVTILATYGMLVVIFQYGYGSGLLGFEPSGRLFVTTPVLLFVMLFALSTDYEVFMLSRVREEFERTGDIDDAVAIGLERTAPVITLAGLVLIGTFASFGASRVIFLKELGLGLAIGVFLDTTVVRLLLVPSSMRLMGSLNWWLPAWLEPFLPVLRHETAESPQAEVVETKLARH
jgi:RND superfamily putative drug exporter